MKFRFARHLLFLGALLLLGGTSGNDASTCGNLVGSDNFLTDSKCCTPDTSPLPCADVEFCMGVMMAHENSTLGDSCCDSSDSCRDYRSLSSTLDKVLTISYVDTTISGIIVICMIGFQIFALSGTAANVAKGVGAGRRMSQEAALALLELCDFGAGLANLILVISSGADGIAENLLDARCFSHTRDEYKIGQVYDQLRSFRNVAIAEIVGDFLQFLFYLYEWCAVRDTPFIDDVEYAKGEMDMKVRKAAGWTSLISLRFGVDIAEFVLAAYGLWFLLIPSIDDLNSLHDTMVMDPDTQAGACILTCCLDGN